MENAEVKIPNQRSLKNKIPKDLIFEELDGIPLYYRGYNEVIKKSKTLEDIMGSSTLQMVITDSLLRLFFKNLDEKRFYIGTNEVGLHLDKNTNLSNDIAIYEKRLLIPEKINNKYFEVPPVLVVEVDTKIDLSVLKYQEYVHRKTQKLLDFGTEKVIWIFTETKKVMTATQQENWQTMDWHKEFEIVEDLKFNLGAHLNQQGIIV